MFLCRRVLHLWVSVKRRPTYAAVDVVGTHITNKKEFVQHVDMGRLPACENSTGPRRLTVLRLNRRILF